MKGLICTFVISAITFTLSASDRNWARARLEMDAETEVILGAGDLHFGTKPAYPRMRRMAGGAYILAWQETIPGRSDDNGRSIHYAISDDLKHWTPSGCLFRNRQVVNVYGNMSERLYSCPEFLVKSNGDIMAVCSFWNLSTYSRIEGRPDHGLAVRTSSDDGKTWSDEVEIFHGQCWEPFLMEMPDGRIHCYFTEARSWIDSGNSGTSLIESSDGGLTWTPALGNKPYRVMRKRYWNPRYERYQYTDQMPTGVVLDSGGKMAFAMEDYDMGKYSLGIVFSPDDGKWKHLQGADVGPAERLDSLSVNATGPYMVKFPSGEILVAFTRNKGMEWPLMYRIGSPEGDAYGPEMKAFDRGGWASACVDSPNTVVMVAPYRGGRLHLARFTLVYDN